MRQRLHIVSTSEDQQPTQVEHTSEQVLNEHSYSKEEAESTENASLPKRVRGYTRKQAIWDLESNEHILVTLNESGQPVGAEGTEFTSFLGTLVKMSQHVSIDVDDWRKISKDKKEDLWNLVKVECEKNKKIRLKSNEPHVTGTKSFARLIDEETKKNGVRPTRAAVYRISRTRKDGSIVNASAAEVMDKLQEISDASNGGSTEPKGGVMDWTNDDLAKVKGREKGGRIRCLGKVVKAKSHGSRSQQDEVPILKARINELEDEMKEMKVKRAEAKEMNDMRERQELMLRFMSVVKEQLPNGNFSNVFNGLNVEVPNDSCSAYEMCSNVNPTLSRGSQNRISGPCS